MFGLFESTYVADPRTGDIAACSSSIHGHFPAAFLHEDDGEKRSNPVRQEPAITALELKLDWRSRVKRL